MHLCAELIAVSMMLEPLGKVGANFSLQLSSRTQFTKINDKKVIVENQCKKQKIEFFFFFFFFFFLSGTKDILWSVPSCVWASNKNAGEYARNECTGSFELSLFAKSTKLTCTEICEP